MAQASPARVLISSEAAKKVVVEGGGHQIIDRLRANGAERVQLLLYLRSPFAVANASYSQTTSSLRGDGVQLANYLRFLNSGAYYRYDRFLDLAAREDVELTVLPYDAGARGSILTNFWSVLGTDLAAGEEPRLNRSFGPVALEAMRFLTEEAVGLDRKAWSKLRKRVREIGRSLAEEPYWGVNSEHERLLEHADRRTDEFARAVWGKGWRDVIGDETRPLNVFHPDDPTQTDMLRKTLAAMKAENASILERRRSDPGRSVS